MTTAKHPFPISAAPRSIVCAEGFSSRILAGSNLGFLIATKLGAAVSCSAPGDRAGQPTRRFRKELIRVGNYVKPDAGLEFSVGPEALDHWAQTFALMLSNGVDVTVPVGHTGDAEANRGYVRDIYREGDSLFGILELVGEDAIALAGRTDVSIYSPPEYTDGKGNHYVRPITHVALTTSPVVSGLRGFEALAASLTAGQTSDPFVLVLQQEGTMPDELTPAAPVADSGDIDPRVALKKSFRAQVMKAFDDDALDTRATLDTIKNLLKQMEAVFTKLGGPATPAPTEPDPEVPAVVAASLEPNRMMLDLVADNRRLKIDALVTEGFVNQAARDKLIGQFVGSGDTLAFDLSTQGNAQFDGMIAVIRANGPIVNLGEKTKGQTLALANPLAGDTGKNVLVTGAEKMAEAAAKARTAV